MRLRAIIRSWSKALAVAAISLLFTACGPSGQSSANPTGTWQVTHLGPSTSQTAYKPTLKLRLERGKLTGTLSRSHNGETIELVIGDAKLKGNDIAFTVAIPPVSGNAPDYVRNFQGKITGDIIKGKVQDDWMGQTHTLDWEAKRLKK